MAEDMVAELTLRLQNQMSAGLDELKQEFGALNGTFGETRDELAELEDQLRAIMTPPELAAGMTDMVTQTGLAVDKVDALGASLDADMVKIGEMSAAWNSMKPIAEGASGVALPGEPGGGPAVDPNQPPVIAGGGDNPPPDEPDNPSGDPDRPAKKSQGGLLEANAITDLLLIGTGYEGAQYDAKLQKLLANITDTEHVYGAPADAEQLRLGNMMHGLAQTYYAQSDDLLATYNYLITTGMKPKEVDALMPGLAEAAAAHGVNPTDMGQAVMALAESFKIAPQDMGAALGQLGQATKMGHFGMDSFSQHLPVIGGALSSVGVSGDDSLAFTAAAMESIIKNVSIPSEAATDYTDFIHYIGTQHAERSFLQKSRMMLPQMREIFSKYGIKDADLWGMENQAESQGKDPIQTVLDFVHNATKDMTPADRNAVASDYFTNQQGGDAVRAIMQYWNGVTMPDGTYQPGLQQNYQALKQDDQTQLDKDFHAATEGATGDMVKFAENMNRLNEMMGQAFRFFVVQPTNALFNVADDLDNADNQLNTVNPYPVQGTRFHAPFQNPNAPPIQMNITVHHDKPPSVTTRNVPPGVNLNINQGNMLTVP